VLGRSGRLFSGDGWVAVGGETLVGRGARDAELFRAEQSWLG